MEQFLDRGEIPLSFSQRSLFFFRQLEPHNPYYIVRQALRLKGPLNTEFLKRALDVLVSRHEILRATIKTRDMQPFQVIAPTLHIALPIIDLGHLSDERREAEAKRLALAEAKKPFDFEEGPLFRFILIRLHETEHILLITMHHIITDAWSLGIFNRELWTLYLSFLSGTPADLPDLKVQYSAFARSQEQWMKSETMTAQLTYWKKRLEGIPAVLDLPIDRARPAIQTYRGENMPLEIPEALTASLRSLGRRAGATLYMVLLAAFQTLLHRYTAQSDILVGSPIANRTWGKTDNIFGFFVNTLVMRADFSGNPTFRQLLGQVRETALDAYENQNLPFEKLVEELRPERDLSRNPIFQVMFALQNTPKQQSPLPDIVITQEAFDTGTAIFDLTLSLREDKNALRGRMNYNTDLFDAETIRSMTVHFTTLLESIPAGLDQPVSTLTILTEDETRRILQEWNDTGAEYPKDKCIQELFEEQVEKTPDSSVISGDRQLSYLELNCKSNQLARHLKQGGVGPGTAVGICVERSLEMLVGILGILKAGATYVPLDPSYPEDRLGFMIADTGISRIVTAHGLLDKLPSNGPQVLALDDDWNVIAREGRENLPRSTSAEDPCCIIYTSGTTGRPKGVMISHRSVCNHLFWRHRNMALAPSDRVLQMASLSFDVSLGEIFECLTAGAQLILSRPHVNYDSAYLVDTISRQQITVVSFSITVLASFLDEPRVAACKSLRRVNTGGEVMSVALKEQFCRLLNADLNYGYGPTETTIGVTYWRCNESNHPLTVPIGRPIANTRIYIRDPYLQPVPVGVPGEIHIGGDAVALGYFNRPQLTAQKFLQDPFSREAGSRLYKTGDFARYLKDGNIEFLGRSDHQVKVRGFRIELGEIEATLNAHADVRESAVVVHEGQPGDARLVAYVVPKTGSTITADEMRGFLRKQLPHYMMPSSYIFLDALPLTSTGKVDRNSLPDCDAMSSTKKKDMTPPRTSMEKMIGDVWRELLGLDRVSVDDNFFDLGGHSLLALRCVSRLRKNLRIDLGVRALFENVTIAELAGLIEGIMEGKSSRSGTEDADRIEKNDRREWGEV